MSRSNILGNDVLYRCNMLDIFQDMWKLDVKFDIILRLWCAL